MKRKAVIFLLMLSLTLMPLTAFADDTEIVNGQTEVSEEVSEEVEEAEEVSDEEVSEEAEEAFEEDEEVSHPALNASAKCSHKNTHVDESRDWDSAKYTSVDDISHKVTGPVDIETWCDDCGALVKSERVTKTETEEHFYENHICSDCGHKNSCKHLYTDTTYEWEDEDVTITSVNDQQHSIRGQGELITYCKDCGEELSSKTVTINTKADHDYTDNVCAVCGHKNGCKHNNQYTVCEWDKDVKYAAIDKARHSVTGRGQNITYCEDCGNRLSAVSAAVDSVEYHNFNSNHVCTKCGYKNSCKHPSTYVEYEYDCDACTITDQKDNGHKVTGKITRHTYCRECEELIKTEDLGHKTVSEPHYYDIGDECIYCGHHWGARDTRIYGQKRYDTSIAVAEKSKNASFEKFDNIIVAYGRNFPDALSGGYLADVKNAPILLVEASEETRVADYIGKNLAAGGKVYILGGTGVVSSAFENKVKAKGISTERLGGQTRYETNLAILKAAGVKDQDILICTGTGYADSLSASSVGKPILLVSDTLTSEQKKFLKSLNTKQIYLIGGAGVVKPNIERELKGISRAKMERLWGQSRYETSTAVAKKFFAKATTVVLAYAQNFPDGLSGGPLAMLKNAPIVLTDSRTIAPAREYVKKAGVVRSITIGGPTLISDVAVKAIMGR